MYRKLGRYPAQQRRNRGDVLSLIEVRQGRASGAATIWPDARYHRLGQPPPIGYPM